MTDTESEQQSTDEDARSAALAGDKETVDDTVIITPFQAETVLPLCFYCGAILYGDEDEDLPYCSKMCAIDAERHL